MIDITRVNISEDEIVEFDKELLDILLYDRTTNHNIIWATDDYQEKGEGFTRTDHITAATITGKIYIIGKTKCTKNQNEKYIF